MRDRGLSVRGFCKPRSDLHIPQVFYVGVKILKFFFKLMETLSIYKGGYQVMVFQER